MNKTFCAQCLEAFSDNLKSKIENLKLVGLSFVLVLVVAGAAAEAQQPKKVPRIGYLSPFDPVAESTRSEATRRALRELAARGESRE
jgi:hypothetical protein